MMLEKSFNKNIAAIYFIANSALALLKTMRANYFVANELSKLPVHILIGEFKKRAGDNNPKSSTDIAELYAIFIALTFKEKNEVENFFTEATDIKFEWFSEIAKSYLTSNIPKTSYDSHQIPLFRATIQNLNSVAIMPSYQKADIQKHDM